MKTRWKLPWLLFSLGSSIAMAEDGPYLFDALQKDQQFHAAFDAVLRDRHIPDWVKTGGTASPGHEVSVNGTDRVIYTACKPHDCPAEQILLLHSPSNGRLTGVFVKNEQQGQANQGGGSTRLTWLGSPLESEKRALLGSVSLRTMADL